MVGDPNNQIQKGDGSVTTGASTPPDGESLFWIDHDDTERMVPAQFVHDLILRDVDLSDLWPDGYPPPGEEHPPD